MKRLLIVAFGSIMVLSGCLNPAAVGIVDDMYTYAIMEEEQSVEFYFSEEFLDEHPLDSLMEELTSHMRHAGGVTLLNTIELTRNHLNQEIVEKLDEKYDDEWYFIVNDADDEHVMTWVVIKTSTQYEIVEGQKITASHYHNQVKK